MSILFIQPVFAPDRARLDRNLDSIKSFANYIKSYPEVTIDIIFGGWCNDESYWVEIKNTIAEHIGPGIPIKKFDRNYGKATVVNTLYNSRGDKNYTYLLTADSDIVFDANIPQLFERCVEAAQESENTRQKPFGIMALNQKGQNCHMAQFVYQNRHKYQGKYGEEEIVWPHGAGGVAGGCLFTSIKCWEATGGYRIMSVYSGDDAYYLLDAAKKGYSLQMFETGPIIHPLDDDEEYAKWKVKVCQRDSGPRRDNINNYINEADDFWKNRTTK